MIRNARRRAQKAGVPFDLSRDDFDIPARCPVLGVPLVPHSGRKSGGWDYSPSLDRILPSFGYVRGNVIVVSRKANSIKHTANPRELRLVAEFYEDLISSKIKGA